MQRLLFMLVPLFLYGAGDFITQREYASQLFKNPRGIGCQHCHAQGGEGKLIANYTHKKKQMSFRGPAIDTLEYKVFYRALKGRINGMPRYFLTDEEIRALYFHVHKDDKKQKQNEKKNAK